MSASVNASNMLAAFVATLSPEARAAAASLDAARSGKKAARLARQSARKDELVQQRDVAKKLKEIANLALLSGIHQGLAAVAQSGPGLASGGQALGVGAARFAAIGKIAGSVDPFRIHSTYVEADKAQMETTATYLKNVSADADDDVREMSSAQDKAFEALRGVLDSEHRSKEASNSR
ncbi:MAG: hypothetical protein KC503_18970 [Myxococcales bacterium]|nr:hypothetical protein [Myxococcales bacterium]